MTDIAHANALPPENPVEVRTHRKSFDTFVKFATFSTLHVALILASLALAFFGHATLFAILLGVGGTVALIVAFVVFGS